MFGKWQSISACSLVYSWRPKYKELYPPIGYPIISVWADSQADNRHRQLHRQLLSLLPQLQIISHTMAKTAAATMENPTPTHARWTRKELMHLSTIFINIVQSKPKEGASRIPPSVEQFNISRDFIQVVSQRISRASNINGAPYVISSLANPFLILDHSSRQHWLLSLLGATVLVPTMTMNMVQTL